MPYLGLILVIVAGILFIINFAVPRNWLVSTAGVLLCVALLLGPLGLGR